MLDDKLEEYAKSDMYPFHMPGHKRQNLEFPNPYEIDITEIDGFDNMHHPKDIIKSLMDDIADLYHSDTSYLLVNGSTCGNLSAIFAACKPGDEVLVARNCHKSVYQAIKIRQLKAYYVYPEIVDGFLQGEILPEKIEKELINHENIKAVILTSPTYEGMISDMKTIVSIAHKYHAAVILDSAHGAHFGFHDRFPESPIDAKPDITIMSLHKTLPAFTQTGVLHYMENPYVSKEQLEEYLGVFQTSSPSYLFMASICKCVKYLRNQKESFNEYVIRLDHLLDKWKNLKNLSVIQNEKKDIGKIVISTANTSITGEKLSEILREQYHLEMEMASFSYVLAMTSVMDTDEGIKRLCGAILEIDEKLSNKEKSGENKALNLESSIYCKKEKRLEICDASLKEKRKIKRIDAAGKICGKEICLYPPGIPVIVPGEIFTNELLIQIQQAKEAGLSVTGITMNEDGDIYVSIVK